MGSGRPGLISAIAWLVVTPAVVAAPAKPMAPFATLEIVTGSSRSAPPDRRPPPAGTTLFLNTLDERGREELAGSLERLGNAIDRRKNLLFVPLEGDSGRAEIETLLRSRAPASTAAAALSAGRWQSSAGDVSVRTVGHCPRGAHCVALPAEGSPDELERRARFLAWPVGYAIVVRVTPAAAAARIADRVRAVDNAQIALVLTDAELHSLRRSPALTSVVKRAAHIVEAATHSSEPLIGTIQSLARAPALGDEAPWLRLPSGGLLIVPRLGALATPDVFVEEVRTRLRGANARIDWLASPR